MTVNWKKGLIVVLDVLVAAYLVLAITAFNKPEEVATVCSEVDIDIAETLIDGFLDEAEVNRILKRNRMHPYEQPMALIDTRHIEETLQNSPFVESAECYKTQSGHVCISLTQRMPIVRVMAEDGDSYYVDSHSEIMPAARYASNLIVATGAISRKYAQEVLAGVVSYVINDKFWQNQIEQINVLADGSLEIVPRVGDHIAYLGAPHDVPRKLERLRKFYKYGLNAAGWNKYSYISVEFDNQIVCKKRQTP